MLVHATGKDLEHLGVVGQVDRNELSVHAVGPDPVDREHVPPVRGEVSNDGAANLSAAPVTATRWLMAKLSWGNDMATACHEQPIRR